MTGTARQDEEIAFLAGYDASRYPRPSVTVDVVLLTVRDGALWTLLGLRSAPPAKDRWALPGGFVGIDEAIDDAAARVLHDKAGLADVFVEQLFTFGAPDRDPRTRVISVAYYALVDSQRLGEAVASVLGDRLCIARVEVDDGDDVGDRTQGGRHAAPTRLRPCGHPRDRGPPPPRQARLRPPGLRAPAA